MIHDVSLMLIILNPFAQMLYLSDLMQNCSTSEFRKIFIQASFLTLAICLFFAWTGDFMLSTIFQVKLPAVRIFGGMIILTVAYTFIMHGPEGVKLFRGDVTEISQQIALPLLVGPGIIWVCIHIGRIHTAPWDVLTIASALLINGMLVLVYQRVYKNAHGRLEMMLLKYFAMAMRLNALMIGAVSVQMILAGIQEFIQEGVRQVS
ncbi:MAG: MarC family protein [bacterium]